MNAPDPDLLGLLAAELGVDESFVEKDWHVVQAIAALSEISHKGFDLVFSGGTSLSKAYGLIERFSEDIDFKVIVPKDAGRAMRRNFRDAIVSHLRENGWKIENHNIRVANESRFFEISINYESLYGIAAALRPHLLIQMTLAAPQLVSHARTIQSFVSRARKEPPEVAAIACVAPVETAADKLSALIWRVPARHQDSDDRSLVRHIHDLAALETTIAESSDFKVAAFRSIEADTGRLPGAADLSAVERAREVLELLRRDKRYRTEYDAFVSAMSYAREGETPTFDSALQALERIVGKI